MAISNSITLLHQEAELAIQQKNYRLAYNNLSLILNQDPFFADAYFLLGVISSVHLQLNKALELLLQADKLFSDSIEYKALIAKTYAQLFQPMLSYSMLINIENFLSKTSSNIEKVSAYTLDTIGVTYSHLGLHEKAKYYFELACKHNATNSSYLFNLATSLRFTGNFSQARQYYQSSIAHNPHYYKAYSSLSSLSNIDNLLSTNQLETLLNTTDNIDHKLHIAHALAKTYEISKNYEQCFTTLQKIKAIKLGTIDYSLADDQALFKTIHQQFNTTTSANKQVNALNTNTNNEAIFIVGMPRTGTTLVERILSNHPQVTSAGELQNFARLFKQFSQSNSSQTIDIETIQQSNIIDFEELGNAYIESTRVLTGTTDKFIDKMPLNVLYAGFIIKALPKAKIICLERNPLDTVVSNFKQLFTTTHKEYNYAYDLNWTAEYYLLFKKLIKFWQQLYPDNFYIINYEKLVGNPNNEMKKLFSFCELSWQPDYINITNNNAPVATPSTLQVRTPIHNKSVNHWKHFNAHLNQVKKILSYY